MVEPPHGVGDAALDGLGDVPAVTSPVQYPEQFAGLVRPLQDTVHDLPVRGPPVAPAASRAWTYSAAPTSAAVRRLPSPRSQPSRPAVQAGSLTASSRTSVGEAVVAGRAGLVEGLLGDEVGHRQQEELGAGVPLVAAAALVGAPAPGPWSSRARWAAPYGHGR